MRIKSYYASALSYDHHQVGTRSLAALNEEDVVLSRAELLVPAMFAVHIPGVENWQVNFLSFHRLDPEENAFHPEVFDTSREHQMWLSWHPEQTRQVCCQVQRPLDLCSECSGHAVE